MRDTIAMSGYPEPTPSNAEALDGDFLIDAGLLGELLGLPASRVPELMRDGEITSVCERGVDDDEGKFRLTFFYGNRRVRLNTEGIGRVVRRSVIDFGDRPIPDALRRSR